MVNDIMVIKEKNIAVTIYKQQLQGKYTGKQ